MGGVWLDFAERFGATFFAEVLLIMLLGILFVDYVLADPQH